MKGENCVSDGIRVLNAADIKAALPPRKAVSNKGDYGRAAIAAGCMRYGGAAVLAAQAALCGGAGYTALFVPEKLRICLTGRVPEALTFSACRGGEWKLDGKRLRNILQYDAIAAGMGMGNTKSAAKVIAYLLKNYGGKLLLDADGLNSIAATYGVRGRVSCGQGGGNCGERGKRVCAYRHDNFRKYRQSDSGTIKSVAPRGRRVCGGVLIRRGGFAAELRRLCAHGKQPHGEREREKNQPHGAVVVRKGRKQ